MQFFRPCWAEIDLAALQKNFHSLRQRLSPSTQVLAVVKANAYGHGLVRASHVAVQEGAAYLGVSSLEEGVALREVGIRTPILILGTLFPFDNFPVFFEKHLTPTVGSLEAAQSLDALALQRQHPLPVHLKIDSGFGRIGVSYASALEFIRSVQACTSLTIEGIYTHFASSDVDPDYTEEQRKRFDSIIDSARSMGVKPLWVHMANSAALLRFPQTHGTMVRPGLALYGVPPYPGAGSSVSLFPVLTWKTRIIFLKHIPMGTSISYARTWTAKRPSRIATLAVGYADGYPRLLSNKGQVLIHGQRVPVVGRVTMDMMMVDVTDVHPCHVGDEAVLIGTQKSSRLSAEEVAEQAQTNPYEILCGIAERVPRVYINGPH